MNFFVERVFPKVYTSEDRLFKIWKCGNKVPETENSLVKAEPECKGE